MHGRFAAQVAQHPFHVAGGGQATAAAGPVAHGQRVELDGGVARHVYAQAGFDAVFHVLKHGVAKAVARHVGRYSTRRVRRRRPVVAADFVAQVEGFAAGVGHAVVAPWGQPEFVRVAAPTVGLAAFGHHRAEVGVGDDVDPGRGGALVGCGGDDIFLAVGRKAAQPVAMQQPGRRRRGGGVGGGRQGPRRDHQRRHAAFRQGQAVHLIRQGAQRIAERHPRYGQQQRPVFFRNLITRAHEDAARAVDDVRFHAR
ncbi:hypothetical protein D3C85_133460 [compost metagenome]